MFGPTIAHIRPIHTPTGHMTLLLNILAFLLNVVFDLFAILCLLRLYMQLVKASFMNPVGQGIIRLTNWLVLPLQRILLRIQRFDLSSFLAAYLCSLLHFLILWTAIYLSQDTAAVAISSPLHGIFLLLFFALLNVIKLMLYLLSLIVLLNAILSWLQPNHPFYGLTQQLSVPLVNPVRKVIPSIGGLDLSPFIVLIILQVLLIIVNYLMR